MSKTSITNPETSLQDVRVHNMRHSRDFTRYEKRGTPKVSSSSDFVYVNSAYVGSVNSINSVRVTEPPTSVIREQYWTCSKWTFAQRIMAIAVAVLTGAVIGLALTVALKKGDTDNIPGLFRTNLAPD
ncbi:PREDICTED: uncharacterized protein LOC106113094 [Papilio xuthus]|uniref:Uncharacterized protein LOC106113094 n=1 Tax=Papilio xuthus TaxID=66420 RepID=A0AAJ7E3M7_PAPXU|nr:PREDICTED: uncharacterized protein LOC106113094 [Papilio xuthus]